MLIIIYIILVIISYYWSRYYIRKDNEEFWDWESILMTAALSLVAPILSSIMAVLIFGDFEIKPPKWL